VFTPNEESIMAQSYSDKVGDVSQSAGRAAGYTERAVEGAKDYASDAADRVTSLAKDAYDNPERFITENREKLSTYTRENPVQALAIAAGIAFVAGAIWKR
jgi:ElaB/YqjD/DUF883 family membrane-anchored ribosome-binding protein